MAQGGSKLSKKQNLWLQSRSCGFEAQPVCRSPQAHETLTSTAEEEGNLSNTLSSSRPAEIGANATTRDHKNTVALEALHLTVKKKLE